MYLAAAPGSVTIGALSPVRKESPVVADDARLRLRVGHARDRQLMRADAQRAGGRAAERAGSGLERQADVGVLSDVGQVAVRVLGLDDNREPGARGRMGATVDVRDHKLR